MKGNLFGKINMSNEMEDVFANQLYDVYISYSMRDSQGASALKKCLEEKGVSVRFGLSGIPSGENISDATIKAIAGSKIFLPIITKNSINSRLWISELDLATEISVIRSKTVIPVLGNIDISEIPEHIKNQIVSYKSIKIELDNFSDIKTAADKIADYIFKKTTESTMLEKVIEYSRSGLKVKASDVLCDVIEDFCKDMTIDTFDKEKSSRLLFYVEKLEELYNYDYSADGRALAHKKLDAIGKIKSLLKDEYFICNAYGTAIAIRIMYTCMLIHIDIADAMTGGDVSDGIVDLSNTRNGYIESQKNYVSKYHELKTDLLEYDEEEKQFILDAEKYLCTDTIKERSFVRMTEPEREDSDLLKSVAKFMHEGNKIFDMIGNDRPAQEFIKCLITSYERLKVYSEIVGAQEVCAECIEKIAELKQKLTRVSVTAVADEKAQTGIKSLLGLTTPKSGEFDVFISHKSEDFDLAVDVYEFLKANLKESFFDKYSLPEMSEAKYRKAIMDALEGSKHFVVILSKLEYLESFWVSLEMEVFQAEKDEGRKNGNFLMVVTDDVYDEIMKSNKKVLPIAYRRCEIIKVKDYKNVLIKYLG